MISATRIVGGIELRVDTERARIIRDYAFDREDFELAALIDGALFQPIPQIGEPVSGDLFAPELGPQSL